MYVGKLAGILLIILFNTFETEFHVCQNDFNLLI